jgi:hypothetical protein
MVTEVLEFAPTVPVEGAPVEFRLVYEGVLSGASGDKREKHVIRKAFGEQLRELWKVHPALSWWPTERASMSGWPDREASKSGRTWLDLMMERHGGFVPLVTEDFALTCDLDILFLRRDAPGRILSSGGGDIDRRLITLFDALRKPTIGEVDPLDDDEKPFYVLLEDDSLVTKVAVTTDRLLISPEKAAYVNNVHLILTVRVNITDAISKPTYFLG